MDVRIPLLTERGRSLLPHLDSLISWAIENFDAIISNRSNPTKCLDGVPAFDGVSGYQ